MKTNEIANQIGGTLIGDANLEIEGIASLKQAGKGDLSFVESLDSVPEMVAASCVLTREKIETIDVSCQILVKNPKIAFSKIAKWILPPERSEPGIKKNSLISDDARIAESASVGNFCTVASGTSIGADTIIKDGVRIAENVKIGNNCIVHSNSVIEADCEIGNGVIIHPCVVLGADGFGYVRDEDAHIKFPQIGRVVIEDDCEIGANTCIDRGSLGETRIGAGTKIDNLVQVAHNVTIGKRVIIAAQTGIAGSTVIEDDAVFGGQVGISDHCHIGKGTSFGAKSAVYTGKKIRGGAWWGIPAQPLDKAKRRNARLNSIGRLIERVKKLESKSKN